MKLKKDDIVEIQWLDIIASSAWHKEEQASRFNPADCKSLGYFLNEDKNCVRISSTVGMERSNGRERDIIVIPKGCIVKIRKLK